MMCKNRHSSCLMEFTVYWGRQTLSNDTNICEAVTGINAIKERHTCNREIRSGYEGLLSDCCEEVTTEMRMNTQKLIWRNQKGRYAQHSKSKGPAMGGSTVSRRKIEASVWLWLCAR